MLVCSGNATRNEPIDDNISVYDEVADVNHYDEIGPFATPHVEDAYTVPVDEKGQDNSAYQALFEGDADGKLNVNESAEKEAHGTYIHPSSETNDTNDTNDTYIHPSADTNETYIHPSSDTNDDTYIHP